MAIQRYLRRPAAGSSSDGSIRGPPSCHEPPSVLSNTVRWAMAGFWWRP